VTDAPETGLSNRASGSSIDWIDVVATIVMAFAALLTAWSAYQSDQWGDTMTFSFSEAAAARTEATRLYTRAGQEAAVDVATFIAWMEAAYDELAAGEIDPEVGYVVDPGNLSGLLYERLRPEFRTAMDAWLATKPFQGPDAAPTPFAIEEYQNANEIEAARLQEVADDKAAQAHAADNNDDKYVLSTIIFASIFLFAGLSTKMRSRFGQYLMLGASLLILVGGGIYLATVPVG